MILKNTCQSLIRLWKVAIRNLFDVFKGLVLIAKFLLEIMFLGFTSLVIACAGTLLISAISIPVGILQLIFRRGFSNYQDQLEKENLKAITSLIGLQKFANNQKKQIMN